MLKSLLSIVFFFLSLLNAIGQNNTNALHFDGADDYIRVSTTLPVSTANFTIELWVKPGSIDASYHGIFGSQNSSGGRGPSLWVGPNGNLHCDSYSGGVRYDGLTSGNNFFTANTWTHVAWVKDATTYRVFKNGVQHSTSFSAPSNVDLVNAFFDIGRVDNYFYGIIDEVRIWNVARTQSQISSYKDKQINGSMTGLVASYHFNQGTASGSNSGVTTLDVDPAFSSSYNGVLNNFSLSGSTSNWVSAGLTLPVTWQSFTATKKPTTVELNWSTASEQNTKDFEVQYSTNTQDWSVLGTVAAAGNSSTTKEYNFTHNSPLKRSIYNFYRIKQNDLDGKFSYSKIVSIVYNEPGPEVQVYPNPVKDVITIYLAESQQLRLVNMAGATVWQGFKTAGRSQLSVSHLPKGVYMLLTVKGPQQILIQ